MRISSENVEGIGLSPVVAQDMPFEDLVSLMLGVTGKDPARIAEIIARGSLVSGASRLRWSGFDVLESEIASYLDRFPDSDPGQVFAPERCFLAVIQSGSKSLPLEREAGLRRRFLRRRSFWDELLAMVKSPIYLHYSYRDRGDVFAWKPDSAAQERLRDAARLLPWSALESQIRAGGVAMVHLYVRR